MPGGLLALGSGPLGGVSDFKEPLPDNLAQLDLRGPDLPVGPGLIGLIVMTQPIDGDGEFLPPLDFTPDPGTPADPRPSPALVGPVRDRESRPEDTPGDADSSRGGAATVGGARAGGACRRPRRKLGHPRCPQRRARGMALAGRDRGRRPDLLRETTTRATVRPGPPQRATGAGLASGSGLAPGALKADDAWPDEFVRPRPRAARTIGLGHARKASPRGAETASRGARRRFGTPRGSKGEAGAPRAPGRVSRSATGAVNRSGRGPRSSGREAGGLARLELGGRVARDGCGARPPPESPRRSATARGRGRARCGLLGTGGLADEAGECGRRRLLVGDRRHRGRDGRRSLHEVIHRRLREGASGVPLGRSRAGRFPVLGGVGLSPSQLGIGPEQGPCGSSPRTSAAAPWPRPPPAASPPVAIVRSASSSSSSTASWSSRSSPTSRSTSSASARRPRRRDHGAAVAQLGRRRRAGRRPGRRWSSSQPPLFRRPRRAPPSARSASRPPACSCAAPGRPATGPSAACAPRSSTACRRSESQQSSARSMQRPMSTIVIAAQRSSRAEARAISRDQELLVGRPGACVLTSSAVRSDTASAMSSGSRTAARSPCFSAFLRDRSRPSASSASAPRPGGHDGFRFGHRDIEAINDGAHGATSRGQGRQSGSCADSRPTRNEPEAPPFKSYYRGPRGDRSVFLSRARKPIGIVCRKRVHHQESRRSEATDLMAPSDRFHPARRWAG